MRVIDPEQDAEPLSGEPQAVQVLVADDSPVCQKLVRDALFYQPYSLIYAKSGKEALELVAKHSPPIVVTDWMMPDLTGLELCQRIRETSQANYTYIILLTGMADSDSLVKGLEAGADEFLTKPFDPAELQARLGVGRRIVQLHRQVEAKDKQLEKTARVDSLTGLPNHMAIQEWATWQFRSGADHGFPLWMVLADIDSFQNLNEKFGREAGDTALKDFAQIMTAGCKPSDIGARVGDDEFCYVLTHLSKELLVATVERIRTRFASHEFKCGSKMVGMTASFGIIGFEGSSPPDFMTMLLYANRALTSAKQAGGNQFRILVAPATK